MEWFGRAPALPARERARATVCARLFDHHLSILGGPLWVSLRKARDEHMFSGMPDSCRKRVVLAFTFSARRGYSPTRLGFADLDINGHRETWPIHAKGFRRWLARCFYQETGGAPSSEALQSTLYVIEAKAHFDAPERIIYIRVGALDGKLYLDLGDENWWAVEIDAQGWQVIEGAWPWTCQIPWLCHRRLAAFAWTKRSRPR
jgi:hypothetical protein